MSGITMGRHISAMRVWEEIPDSAYGYICPLCFERHGKTCYGPREVELKHCERCAELHTFARQRGIKETDSHYNVKTLMKMFRRFAS